MNWFYSLGIGILTAALGCVGAGGVASLCVRWYRISSFEGGSGYYVVGLALLGAVIGLCVGVIGSRFVSPTDGYVFLRGLGVGLGTMGGLLAVAGLLAWLASDAPPRMDGRPLELAVEVRMPDGWTWPASDGPHRDFITVETSSSRLQPSVWIDAADVEREGGQLTLRKSVPLQTRSSWKVVRVYFNRDQDFLFRLPLRSRPQPADLAWSEWITAAGGVSGAPAPSGQPPLLRYRVKKIAPPPPPLTPQERDAAKALAEAEAFAAIAPTAPIELWFPYTQYGADEKRRATAVAQIVAKPGYVAELAALMGSADTARATEALRLVEHLPEPLADYVEPVTQTGRALIAQLRIVLATSAEADPGYEAAADFSSRFSAWMVAVRRLRAGGAADLTPVLGEILTLSRQRDDSYVLRQDVRRVASYYMHEWAGVQPLPGDPKPK